MTEQLYINGISAWTKGICMGEKFLEEINKPSEMKDYIKNESRLKNGSLVIATDKQKMRSLTLTFNIHGNSSAEHDSHRKWLYSQLYKGEVTLTVEGVLYHLLYTGKSISYSRGGPMNSALTVGFDEPDPTDRS